MVSWWALYLKELRLAVRIGGGALMGVLFFLTTITVFPFAIGPDLALISRIGPAILWIGALLATLIGLDRLFDADREDGTLDLLVSSGAPVELIVLVKVAAHWTATGLPLVVVSPLLGLMVALEPEVLATTALTLLIGTPALTCLGAIGAGLTASLRRGGLLIPILILPFSVPVVIFGVAAADAARFDPAAMATPTLLLVAVTLVAAVISPIATAAALRSGLD